MHFDLRWLIVILPLTFPLWWCLLLFSISRFSGWGRLSDQYATDDPPPDRRIRLQKASIGWAQYKGCLKLGIGERGLHLATLFFFRPFHPPVLIPWRAIRAEPVKRWFGSSWRLTIAEASATIEIQDSVYQQLQSHLVRR